MISKNEIKHLKALSTKKQRRLSGTFLVQGEKNALELLDSTLKIEKLYVTERFAGHYSDKLTGHDVSLVTEDELTKASSINSNNAAIAIVQQPKYRIADALSSDSGLIIALDDVNDPGNLGTIIRLADWYGVKHIVLSEMTADIYNPKTISATMGAFTRVQTHRTCLRRFLDDTNKPILGAFLDGNNIHTSQSVNNAVIVMGNESHGISNEISKYVTDKITIPSYGQSESLNVAMATGIILDNIRRLQS